MSSTRPCPHCDQPIQAAAALCRFCREPVSPPEPAPPRTSRSAAERLTRSTPWIGAARRSHWLGVALFGALGLLTLARFEPIHLLYIGLASTIALYLTCVVILQVLRANYHPERPAPGLHDLVEVACLSVALSSTSGFWFGFNAAALDGHRASDTYGVAIMLFSGLLGTTSILGILSALIRSSSSTTSPRAEEG